jgi:hypothetical protein
VAAENVTVLPRQLLIMVLLVIGTVTPPSRTAAYLTSSIAQSGGGSAFSTATIKLDALDTLGSAQQTSLVVSQLAPGDASYAVAQVQNQGTGDLKFGVSTLVTAGSDAGKSDTAAGVTLASGLQLTVRKLNATGECQSAQAATFDTRTLLSGLATALANSSATALEVVPATADTTVSPGTSAIACFKIQLPANASSTLQNKSATIKFEFAAKQASGT